MADNLLNQKFFRYLKSVGRVVRIAKDGNCLYTCFAYHIHNNVKRQVDIRATIARELLKKKEDYQNWVEEDQFVTKAIKILTFDPPEWGEEIDIRVAADYFNINVTVLKPIGGFPKYPLGQPHNVTLYLVYHNNHYDILLPFDENFNPDNWNELSDDEMEESCEESEEEFEMQESLIERPGFQYLANKVYARGRSDLEVIFLIPRELDKGNLVDSVLQAGVGSTLFYYFDYRGWDRWQFQSDADISKRFSLYCQKIQMNWTVRNRKLWLSRYLIPHIILSAVSYKFHGVKLQILARTSEHSLVNEILNCYWSQQRETFAADFEIILKHADVLFCTTCSTRCPYQQYYWHLDLGKFVGIIPSMAANENGILNCVFLYESFDPVNSPVLFELQRLYWMKLSLSKASLSRVFSILDENAKIVRCNYYCSYLVLLLDGPGMANQDAELNFMTLSEDKEVYKIVYAGSCKNEEFRMSHLYKDSSSIHPLLTGNSRLFLLRSQRYTCKQEARKDESIVISILQLYAQNRRNRGDDDLFLLLNLRSENQYLMRSNAEEQKFILDYVASDTPIFYFTDDTIRRMEYEDVVDCFSPRLFTGNYPVGLGQLIDIPSAAYQLRTYEDRVAAYELVKQQNKGFTSKILKRLYSEAIQE